MPNKHFIKCGRKSYEISAGETIMDNGACLQLITKTVGVGWRFHHPTVSKKAFEEFKKIDGVMVNKDHNYGDCVTLWTYKQKSLSEV